jgi:cation:H+ antiporter
MTGILTLVGIFVLALGALIKGADWLLTGAKAVGIKLGVSRFIIGVLIVGFGTSLPELASSLAAAWRGESTIVIANIVGSNITNILLIVGLLVFIGGTLKIKRDLLHTEIPVFFIATAHFLVSLSDGVIDTVEALLLLGLFGAYMWYIISDGEVDEVPETTSTTTMMMVVYILIGLGALIAGAHFAVDSLIQLAMVSGIPIGVVSILALAVGTSLPELVVTLKSIRTGESELAIGNIFGSNAFNFLLIGGTAGLIMPLEADAVVMELGFMVVLVASLMLFVNGLTQRIMRFEGLMYLIFFVFFIVKMTEYL